MESQNLGLSFGTRFAFDYQNQAELLIPAMKYEPSAPQFTEYLIEILPKYLEDKRPTWYYSPLTGR